MPAAYPFLSFLFFQLPTRDCGGRIVSSDQDHHQQLAFIKPNPVLEPPPSSFPSFFCLSKLGVVEKSQPYLYVINLSEQSWFLAYAGTTGFSWRLSSRPRRFLDT
ncbi:hypothetical protein F5X96DRAFT_628491 [Biscogniauxia mediterranea]|nr:hypothetical protein F5X96DRAFT_628491 [Biscogniauxia mediterranea]